MDAALELLRGLGRAQLDARGPVPAPAAYARMGSALAKLHTHAWPAVVLGRMANGTYGSAPFPARRFNGCVSRHRPDANGHNRYGLTAKGWRLVTS